MSAEQIGKLFLKLETARKNNDWDKAERYREKIRQNGIPVDSEDTYQEILLDMYGCVLPPFKFYTEEVEKREMRRVVTCIDNFDIASRLYTLLVLHNAREDDKRVWLEHCMNLALYEGIIDDVNSHAASVSPALQPQEPEVEDLVKSKIEVEGGIQEIKQKVKTEDSDEGDGDPIPKDNERCTYMFYTNRCRRPSQPGKTRCLMHG